MHIPTNQFRRDHPWMHFVLLDSSAGPVPLQAKVTHSLMSTSPVKQCNTLSIEVSVLLHVHSWIFLKDNDKIFYAYKRSYFVYTKSSCFFLPYPLAWVVMKNF